MAANSSTEGNLKFSVVVPVFNEERSLEVLYARLTKVMVSLGEAYEIIFVDDGSADNSFKVLRNLRRKDNRVKVIRFTRNFGQHPAIMAEVKPGLKVFAVNASSSHRLCEPRP